MGSAFLGNGLEAASGFFGNSMGLKYAQYAVGAVGAVGAAASIFGELSRWYLMKQRAK